MSHAGRTPLPPPTPWRFFPLAAIAALGVVVAVNGVLAWAALSSFPGLAVEDDFATSNRYDRILDRASRQAALGWTVEAGAEAGAPVLRLARPDGAPLDGAAIIATAQRPLGPPETAQTGFTGEGGGRYRAAEALGRPGQWELLLSITLDGQTLTATRRIVVK
jgi:nitrogen fixation protein FixH